jgi:hypothetical protein
MKKEWLVKTLALGIVVLFIGTGVVSGFKITDKSNVTNDNHPPDKPIIKGPKVMGPWTYNWTFNATDSDGDNVSYQIDWGDGTITNWTDWYPSGVEIIRSHSYIIINPSPPIKARANDTYGAIGDWGEIMLDYSISEQITNLIFFQFLEQFQNVFQIFRFTKLIYGSI